MTGYSSGHHTFRNVTVDCTIYTGRMNSKNESQRRLKFINDPYRNHITNLHKLFHHQNIPYDKYKRTIP